jgi:hypothetical protein
MRIACRHEDSRTGETVRNGYPSGIDGVLGVTALGCQRVRFDFQRSELGWSR